MFIICTFLYSVVSHKETALHGQSLLLFAKGCYTFLRTLYKKVAVLAARTNRRQA